jgi:ferrochelatase
VISLVVSLHHLQGPWIAHRRTPKIIEQYRSIGGKSPIREWTAHQANKLEGLLDTAPIKGQHGSFKAITAFRYAPPLTADALLQMKAAGIKRAVAFSQYPQYSCTTTGSSLNHLWRECIRLGLENEFQWSVIDRWGSHPTFINAVSRRVGLGLASFPPEVRDKVVILFSAHSLPMIVVNKGDPYTSEVAGTVQLVMERLKKGVDIGNGATDGGVAAGSSTASSKGQLHSVIGSGKNPYMLSWQSKVGFLPWMGPPTGEVLKGLGRQGVKHVLVVPIAFTSDHIETLYEIDQEYAHIAKEAGISLFIRAPSLNDEPLLPQAMSEILLDHLSTQQVASAQYPLPCPGCINPACRSVLNPTKPYTKHRDAAEGCSVPAWPSKENIAAIQAAAALGPSP